MPATTKQTLRSSRPYDTATVFNFKSKKETIVLSEGILRYTKVKNVSVTAGQEKSITVPISKFRALSNIYKCTESDVNWQRICDEGKTLFVIGLPTGEHDPNAYVVYSEDHGVFKRNWSEVSTKEGKRNLEYLGTDTIIFDVLMTGTYETEVCMVALTKGSHVWVSKDWLDEGKFNTAYAQDPQDDSFPQSDAINESPEPAPRVQARETQPQLQPPQEEPAHYAYYPQPYGAMAQYGSAGTCQWAAAGYKHPQVYPSSGSYGAMEYHLPQNFIGTPFEFPLARCYYHIPYLPYELMDQTQLKCVYQF